jgi:hypothetical protein
MLLDDLALYLHAQGCGIATTSSGAARTIFRSWMPDAPDAVLALIEYGGREPLMALGPNSTSATVYELPRVQVAVRDLDYPSARTRAEAAYHALHWVANTTLTSSGPRYGLLTALQPPFALERDANGRSVVAFNLECLTSLSA